MTATDIVRELLEREAKDDADEKTRKKRKTEQDDFADDIEPKVIANGDVKTAWNELQREISRNRLLSQQVMQRLGITMARPAPGKPSAFVRK